MQAIFKNKNEKTYSGKTDSVDIFLHARRISKNLKEECVGGFGARKFRV